VTDWHLWHKTDYTVLSKTMLQ